MNNIEAVEVKINKKFKTLTKLNHYLSIDKEFLKSLLKEVKKYEGFESEVKYANDPNTVVCIEYKENSKKKTIWFYEDQFVKYINYL